MPNVRFAEGNPTLIISVQVTQLNVRCEIQVCERLA